ncbi:MAG: tetratricopeptide repeat protein [Bacteroidales bacterium]
MTESSNKFLRFWEELKRRKVIRVSAMYAATAFIIMEAADIMLPRLGLPDWTVTLIIILLIAGFPIAIILSWIFDVTPEGVEKTGSIKDPSSREVMPSGEKKKRGLRTSDVVIAVLFVIVLILLYPKIFKPDRIEDFRSQGEISVAVMPFQNLTGDTARNFWQVMIQDNLITSLSNSPELKVRQTEMILSLLQNKGLSNYASLTPGIAGSISRKIKAGVFIQGSINQVGPNTRLNAKLVDAETMEVFQSFQVNGTSEKLLTLTDSISGMVKDFLIVTVLEKELAEVYRSYRGMTESPEALRNYIQGTTAFSRSDFAMAREYYLKAIELDTNFIPAMTYLATSYGNAGRYEEARKWSLKAYRRRDRVSGIKKLMVETNHALYFGTPSEVIKYCRQILEMDGQAAIAYYLLGFQYNELKQYNRAIPELEKLLELYDKQGIKPFWVYYYTNLGFAYHQTGQYKKERKLYREAEKHFPNDLILFYRKAILELSTGKTTRADEYIDQYVSMLKERSYSEAAVYSRIGDIYWDARILNKAEEFHRRSLSLEPERAIRLNNLAFLLIDEELNVEEGMSLAEKALDSEPDHYTYLDTRGWGLYKQGRYEEAVEVLEQAWELKPRYNHTIYLHLEAARKAHTGQQDQG